jgi:peptidyl-tRNA hydrolase
MYKQIIIARKDLNMSPGKLAAQVSHGSMAFLTSIIREHTIPIYNEAIGRTWDICDRDKPQYYKHSDLNEFAAAARKEGKGIFYYKPLNPNAPYGTQVRCDEPTIKEYYTKFTIDKDLYEQWINGEFTKCVLQAKNKNQLLKAKTMAEELGMIEGQDFWLIKDNCRTELEPEEDGRTLTVIGFRPMDSKIINQIGKKYHLYV